MVLGGRFQVSGFKFQVSEIQVSCFTFLGANAVSANAKGDVVDVSDTACRVPTATTSPLSFPFSPPLPSVLCYLLSVLCHLYSLICTLPLLTSPPPFSAFTFSFLDYFYYLCRDYEAKKHSKDKQGSTNDNKREETTSAVARIAIIIHSHIPVGGMVLR